MVIPQNDAKDHKLISSCKKGYIKPNDPAVNPTAKKNENSKRSLGRELTINLN